jgi:hypothetical protein
MSRLFQESGGDNSDRLEEAKKLLAMGLTENLEQMSEKERKFVEDTITRIDDYGIEALVSAKQLFWLRDLKDKYCI